SLQAQKDFFKNPGKYTGRPRFPSFLPKKAHYPVEFPATQVPSTLPKPKSLVKLDDVATVDAQERFYSYNVRQALNDACMGRGWVEFTPRHFRIVAAKRNSVKIEAVVHLDQACPVGSL